MSTICKSIPKPSHPSPDKRRENWLNLNGEWDFSFEKKSYDRKITVPFSWTSPLSGIKEDYKGKAFYRKSVSYDRGSERLFLVIGGADYYSQVTVNGVELGKHSGGYARFDFEVTDMWVDGAANTIEIAVEDTDEKYQTYGKQGYGNIRGIWQTVYLEKRPSSYISDFIIRTTIAGNVSFDIKSIGEADKFEVEFEGHKAESKEGKLSLKIDEPELWSPDSPKLYFGRIALVNGKERDVINTYFGIREVGISELKNGRKYITLNGKPIYINGTLDQSFNPNGYFTLPTDEEEENEILRMKNIGLNAARIHIKTEEPLKLYYADLHGLMIIQDIPCFWGEPTEQAKKLFDEQMPEVILRDINHPAIVYWVIYNETWGLFTGKDEARAYLPETQEWVRKNYELVKALDPTRIVEDNSVCNRDHVVTDVNTWHFYRNGYERVRKEISEFVKSAYVGSAENYIAENRYSGEPLMNSECGNVWGVKGNAGDSDISWHYKYMMNEFRLYDELCGFVFTEFHDVVNEFNGYYRIDNTKKDFGYGDYVPGMTLSDLHSADFLAYDAPPMKTLSAGEKVVVPLYISSFTDKYHGKQMKTVWKVTAINGFGEEELIAEDEKTVCYTDYGKMAVGEVSFSAPEYTSVITVKLMLKDADDNIVMRNFVVFNTEDVSGAYELEPKEAVCNGFTRAWTVQEGNKLNCVGGGEVVFTVDKAKLPDGGCGGLDIVFEASAKEYITKDHIDGKEAVNEGNYMLGYRVDRGANRNSFYMTDEAFASSSVTLSAGDIVLGEFELPDSPADSRGSLSWNYQITDDYIDEGGSYGYLCKAMLSASDLAKLPECFDISFKTFGSLSLFGKKSGRYPTAINIYTTK